MFGGKPIDRAMSYERLAQLVESGVSVVESLRYIKDTGKVIYLIENQGKSLSAAMRMQKSVSTIEASVIETYESSGNLPQAFKTLANRYRDLDVFISEIKSRMTYPLFLILSSSFLLPIPNLMSGNLSTRDYLISASILPLIFSSFAFIFYKKLTSAKSQNFIKDGKTEYLWLPMINQFIQYFARSNILLNLSMTIEAGLSMEMALNNAKKAAATGLEIDWVKQLKKEISKGANLTNALSKLNFLTPDAIAAINVGEVSGKLPATLGNIGRDYSMKAKNIMIKLSKRLPALIYIIIVASIIYSLVQNYKILLPINNGI